MLGYRSMIISNKGIVMLDKEWGGGRMYDNCNNWEDIYNYPLFSFLSSGL